MRRRWKRPSRVDASSGEVPAVAVRATATITFDSAKPGLWIHPGKAHAGQVHVVDIGIPDDAPVGAEVGLIGPRALAAIPRREAGCGDGPPRRGRSTRQRISLKVEFLCIVLDV